MTVGHDIVQDGADHHIQANEPTSLLRADPENKILQYYILDLDRVINTYTRYHCIIVILYIASKIN